MEPLSGSTFLARIALEWKLIQQDQLDACIKEQEILQKRGKEVLLGQLLVDRGWLKPADLTRLLAEQKARLVRSPGLLRYDIRERVGEGSTAVVYHAWDRDLGRDVALKLLREEVCLDPVGRERFGRELQSTMSLSHPNVVTVYDGGEASGRLFLVMELVRGRRLSDLLGSRRLGESDLVALMVKVARGVGAAHAKGIIHRDIKPTNILVEPGGEPKVTDFGLARRAVPGAAVTHGVMGTPLYMAPEQVTAKEASPRTDVFGLGAVLYEGLTGTPPHAGRSDMEIYRKILLEPAVPPSQKNPAVSRALEGVVLRALEKDPPRRQADATVLAEELSALPR
ncbi:MAG TPA: protein kinase [Planctomycetota bacterium]|nr:protein kinase [Planctomycetota bacterium]